MSKYFPLFIDISNKKILVVGAGNIAYRRIKTLIPFKAQIRIVASNIDDRILDIKDILKIKNKDFEEKDLENMDIVLACTNNKELNTYIVNLAAKNNVLYNSCTNKEECNFYFPSIILDEDICIGLNAYGKNHSKVKEIRQSIERKVKLKNRLKYE